MVENVARKITLIVALLLVSVLLLVLPDKALNLGLDLQGGTRLVYQLDFDEAIRTGQVGANEDPAKILSDTIDIIRNRVDPTGTREASIRAEGSNKLVVELPGTLDLGGGDVKASLQGDVGDGDLEIRIDEAAAFEFPENGGVVRIDDEDVRYRRRDGTTLYVELTGRGHYDTTPAAHTSGATVRLISDDAIREAIENLGNLSFLIVASPADFQDTDTDLESERSRMEQWVAEHPEASLTDYNKVPEDAGGPSPLIRWYPMALQSDTDTTPEVLRARPLLRPQNPDREFLGSDLGSVHPGMGRNGFPGVGFEMLPQRKGDFGDFTEENINRPMAIVLNDVIESAPTINSRLPGSGIIEGRFTDQEIYDLISVLRSGSLKIRPRLEHEEKVGATLGSAYVERGFYSGIIAVVVVLAFMAIYYRRLGVYAAVALLATFLMLMGGLAFLQATLTLPGIAGIILTIGMAVDANILIFDRIREEIDKGRNIKQGAKTGFDKALSAILDANITTFLTAVILYNEGTGPVRGFAVTLMIGIVTSVFSALVITRVLVHFALERGVKEFRMGTWMVTANYNFLGKTKIAMICSSIAIVGGIGLFWAMPVDEKLGIDFMGGSEVHFRTAEALQVDSVRERVRGIAGLENADVKAVLSSSRDGGYDEFRAIFKTRNEETESQAGRSLEDSLHEALGGMLLAEGILVSQTRMGDTAKLEIHVRTVGSHPSQDIQSAFAGAGLSDVEVTTQGSGSYDVTATTLGGQTTEEVTRTLEMALLGKTDSNGKAFELAGPIASTSTVGPQVVGELKDKALLALAISLFVIVLYISVRFTETSFGLAAVAALTHDVLITLGSLTLVNHFGLLNGEINLPMIAAFLTIIGYSLNDTIVIFDRVRENLPRMKLPLSEILNRSINQTLSRTILTSLTTFLAVLILFIVNFGTGNVMESFSFAMMIGVITGTYSTIFVANPILLWLESRWGHLQERTLQPAAKVDRKLAAAEGQV